VPPWRNALESKQARCSQIMGRLLLQRENQRKSMHAPLVCFTINRKMGATSMSDYVEIIYPQEMKARLMCNGEVVEEYKIEQCDKCSQLRRLDHFGYQKGYDKQDNIIWFCGDCR
jgi:hypothetical protein